MTRPRTDHRRWPRRTAVAATLLVAVGCASPEETDAPDPRDTVPADEDFRYGDPASLEAIEPLLAAAADAIGDDARIRLSASSGQVAACALSDDPDVPLRVDAGLFVDEPADGGTTDGIVTRVGEAWDQLGLTPSDDGERWRTDDGAEATVRSVDDEVVLVGVRSDCLEPTSTLEQAEFEPDTLARLEILDIDPPTDEVRPR